MQRLETGKMVSDRNTYLSNADEVIGADELPPELLFCCWAATTAANLEAVLAPAPDPPANELPKCADTEDTDVLLAPTEPELPPAPLPLPGTEEPPVDDPYLR